jgi:hypothetical protein
VSRLPPKKNARKDNMSEQYTSRMQLTFAEPVGRQEVKGTVEFASTLNPGRSKYKPSIALCLRTA